MLSSVETIQSINTLVKKEIPFLFIISFNRENNIVLPLSQLKANNIFCKTPRYSNIEVSNLQPRLLDFIKQPITQEHYQALFRKVNLEIMKGNTFLLNLTVPLILSVISAFSNYFSYRRRSTNFFTTMFLHAFRPKVLFPLNTE